MMGKGVSREGFQPRSCSGKKENLKNVVYIDDDNDPVDDVVIIDFLEFMSRSHGCGATSRDRVYTPQSVISIDDDDDVDEESDDAEVAGTVAGVVGDLDSDASSSKRLSPDPSGQGDCIHIDVDDIGVCEKESESEVLKGRKGSSANGIGRNRYGLDGSESESWESDCSDCELMDREQWEKIPPKRKHCRFNDQRFYDDQPSSSGLHCNSNVCIDVDEEYRTKQNAGGTADSRPGPANAKYAQENQSSSSFKGDSQVDGFYFNLGAENYNKESDKKVDWEAFKSSLFESTEETQEFYGSSDIDHGKSTRSIDLSSRTRYESYNFSSADTGFLRFKKEFSAKEADLVNLSHEACEGQVSNTGLTRESKYGNLSEVKFDCVDEKHVNCDGLAFKNQDSGVFTSNDNRDIIGGREKLKATDEYIQAMEEEWASRQRQLEIQAEEVRRLRKRKKAEKRLLDMQRRQKERIEEVRETQKKDEEFMNQKEKFRVEIQKGLNQLEMQCHDMISLLRGLGINVGGTVTPSQNEASCASSL
ncbi:hypothetical protein Fmac_003104 [Flemingia macrophylla]|uniref:Uncharacterized protein n=1 Tax=Flemingia macrophylla TaxID=520843 RepID=A0ABD1NLW0_9FABA